jgi:carbon-monoxide dehydrogenase medium subunit
MKPAPFAYARPASLAEALELLGRHRENARILAGGQSLIATLNMRLSTPDILVDIAGIPGLDAISVQDGVVRIGARTSHRAIEQSVEVAKHLPLLTQAAPHIGHVAIRNAGTIGGSIAFADPAAEWPACCIALDASILVVGRKGERRIAARSFYRGLYETALAVDEIITAIEFPILPGYRTAFLELARRHGDYAIVGIAAVARVGAAAARIGAAEASVDRGRLSDVRLAFIGAGPKPTLATRAMAALEGKALDKDVLEAARQALTLDLEPTGDLYSSPATKRHLAGVLLARAAAALTEPTP